MSRYLSIPMVALVLCGPAISTAQTVLIDPPLPPDQYMRLEEMPVMTPAGAKIGVVEDALIDRFGKVLAVAVDLDHLDDKDGGEVIVMLDRFRIKQGALVSTLTRDQLAALPKWAD